MKRKDFIIKTGLVSTGLFAGSSILSSFSSSNISKTNKVINIGVIGTGSRGCGLIGILNKLPEINVIACCDILPFRLENGFEKTNNKAKKYTDYRKLLANKEVDAVLITTTFSAHAQIAIDAIEANKHVYCEKTLAKGYEGIKNLVDKAQSSNVIVQTGHQYHSSRLYDHVVNLIKNGKVGNVTAFECQWNRHGDWRRQTPSPEFEKAVNWRMYKEYSGGLVAELCSHQIDFVNWVLEETPTQVMGVGGINYWDDGRETNDNIHLIYSYPNGVKAKFTSKTSNAKDGGYQIKIIGDKGIIQLSNERGWFYPNSEDNHKKVHAEVDGVAGATVKWVKGKGIPLNVQHAKPTEQALLDFRDSILTNKKPKSNIVTGANVAVCVQMGLDAIHGNKIIHKKKEDFFS